MDLLTNTIAGLPLQQQAPPAGVQQRGTMPPPPADALTEGERMDTDMQGAGSNQGNVAMGDGSGVHGSGNMGPTEAAKET